MNPDFRRDYYELLDLQPTASAEDIKQAYYRLAKKYHPDHNENDDAAEERFKLVAEARRVLADPELRAQYDAWLERETRLCMAPELASMPRRVRMATRRNRERRDRHERPRKLRPFLLSPVRTMNPWAMVLVYAFFAFMIVPSVIKGCSALTASADAPAPAPVKKKSATPKTPEEIQANLQRMNEELRRRAEDGDAAAQVQYGMLLYRGVGIQQDREQAILWWQAAAAQGNSAAIHCLKMCEKAAAAHEIES